MLFIFLILMVGIAGGYEQGNMNFATFVLTELMAFALMIYEYQRMQAAERRRNAAKRRNRQK